ncbi:Uncharacterized conserved protein [Cardiobacterium hominis]|jgi:hypothetical protein|uniref:DUF302 domain-containing protein n=2 Tax=Cardiobacteriaceae TaxID=868 RepID=C8N9M1_CARH6|nr:DUF302 domain-containing protein [Cardiobacterium hominis]EEV88709.1 hypothetical protein HMPREF0198_1199 [Cardiobacterium hominis ATCC 15826]RKW11768.1 MAG: DUF302 domain-containing protein [Cardiobacterium sp.]VEG76278.1 Uncharacterized conserved protein [Cardiobacterium hominis]
MTLIRRFLLTLPMLATAALAQNAPLTIDSRYDFAATVTALETAIQEKGMTLFARIDHQAAAKEAGLDMQPATVLIYGSPKAGTPLMQNDPTLALQLPLKVLITENDGKVQVLLNSAEQVVARSNTPYSAVENTLANAEKLIRATVAVQP